MLMMQSHFINALMVIMVAAGARAGVLILLSVPCLQNLYLLLCIARVAYNCQNHNWLIWVNEAAKVQLLKIFTTLLGVPCTSLVIYLHDQQQDTGMCDGMTYVIHNECNNAWLKAWDMCLQRQCSHASGRAETTSIHSVFVPGTSLDRGSHHDA